MIQRLFSETIIRRDNLQKYHLIVVGGIKAAKLAKAFRQYNQYYNVLLVNQHSKQQISQIFNSMTIDPKSILDGTDIAFTDGIGISQINKDSIELINGRQIQFDKIVFTKEYEDIFEINGLEEALSDAYHPVYARTQNYENKNFMDIFKFKEGDFYFYIPKRPFDGEDHISYLRLIELLPKEVNLHVISPNQNLLGEEQMKQIIERNPNIRFHLNSDITNIDRQNRQVMINDQQFEYDCIYFHGLPQKQLYEQYNNYIVSDSVFEEAKNIIYEFQGQKPLKIKENNQIDNLYIGNYRVQKQFSKPESKVDLVYQKLANSLPAQVWRYLWLTQLNHRLYSTNQLIQSYAKGWKTSKSAPKHVYQKIEVQEIIKPQALPLIYKFSKQQINQSLIKNILNTYHQEQNNITIKSNPDVIKVSEEKVQDVQKDSYKDQQLKNQAEVVNQPIQQEISKQEESVTIKQNISPPPQPEIPQQNQHETPQPAKKQRKKKSK